MNNVLYPEWLRWPQTQALIKAFGAQASSLRFVGGAVRDALLCIPVKDVDAATTLTPEELTELLTLSHILVVPTGIAHGTITAVIEDKHFEITTLRNDVACDGRHAQVSFTQDWREDAARRDFTMNAMYLSTQGELFDYFGGEADARAGRVLFIGDAASRIAEDYLRVLRFFRFYAYYGQGEADATAVAACAQATPYMDVLSGERVQAELLKLLGAPSASDVLALMRERGILSAALSFAATDVGMFARLDRVEQLTGLAMPVGFRLAGFVWGQGAMLAPLADRLRLSNRIEKTLRLLLRYKDDLPLDAPLAVQKKLLRLLDGELFVALVLLSWAAGDSAIDTSSPYRAMLKLAGSWEIPVFPVTGDDLIARGIVPGKEMGEQLKRLEHAWEQADYRLDTPALLALLR